MNLPTYFSVKRGEKIKTGVIGTKQGSFAYTLYFLPIRDNSTIDEIADKLMARREKGKPNEPCLNASRPEIIDQIRNMNIHVYGFVHSTRFPNDHASGALQIGYDGVYITDLCRHYDVEDPRKSKTSPIKVLMEIFEQLVLNELRNDKIKLMVVKNGGDRLLQIYGNYGYVPTHEEVDEGTVYVVMEKTISKSQTYTIPERRYTKRRQSKTLSKTLSKSRQTKTRQTKSRPSVSKSRRQVSQHSSAL